MSTCAWVVGAGGLLGRALLRSLRAHGVRVFTPERRFDWTDLSTLADAIDGAARRFADVASDHPRWEIYWAAGAGTMASGEAEMQPDAVALQALLDVVGSDARLRSRSAAFTFASSAGGVHAGSSAWPITESTPPAPLATYGRAKLAQEARVRRAFEGSDRQAALLARLSTLYGAEQAMGKQQGLLSHIARAIVRNQVVNIYVPQDTQRDYLAVDDAAESLVTAAAALPAGGAHLRLVAAQRSTTIAEIVAAFRRASHRRPRIVTSASASASLYARSMSFRSIHPGTHADLLRRPLQVGVAELLQAERRRFAAGGG